MNPEIITSRDNKLIRHIIKLAVDSAYRREQGEYICEGEKLLLEALRDGVHITAVLWPEASLLRLLKEKPELIRRFADMGCRLAGVSASVFSAVSMLETFDGPLFVCAIKIDVSLDFKGQYIALDRVQDPGNVGTVIRTADAFNIGGVWILDGTADPYQPKTVRAAMGSIFRVPIYRASARDFFSLMDKSGIKVYAATPGGNALHIGVEKLDKCAIIIGNEGQGVRPENIKQSSGSIMIPMPGRAESLNAAVAASIIMWEMSKCL